MKKICIFILCIAFSGITMAQGTSAGVSVLKVPTNALQASLGATSVSTTSSLSAASLNPASIVFPDDRLAVLFTHTTWIGGTTANHLTVSLPTPIGRFAVTTGMNEISDIEVRTQPGPLTSTFSARTAVVGGVWGTDISDGILFGISASYIYDRLYDVEATGFSGSIGLLATGLVEGATVGASISEMGSVSGYKNSSSDLPTRLSLGGSYAIAFGEFSVTPAVSYQSVREGASGIHVGASIGYAFFRLRGSMRTGETTQTGAFGAAVIYRGISVDYALVPFSLGLGSGHLISIGIDL